MYTSVDSDKSAFAVTAGAGSIAGSDIATQLDSSAKVLSFAIFYTYTPLLVLVMGDLAEKKIIRVNSASNMIQLELSN